MITARIFKPTKTAMQSGHAKTDQWVLEYNSPASRKPEPLMGWTQSSDTLKQVRLKFDNVNDAKAYADKQGLNYIVSDPATRKVKPRNYGDNFKYIPVEEG